MENRIQLINKANLAIKVSIISKVILAHNQTTNSPASITSRITHKMHLIIS